ncbi:MAG TPA: hypothetical protein VFC18_04110 [Burkholderiales bacterium]|nr:hypothetical protein [Burkholderiales bacterium]
MKAFVITVGPGTAVRHIAGLLFQHRISASPFWRTASSWVS